MSSTAVDNGTKHVLQDSISTIIEGSASYYSLLKSYTSGIPLASSSLDRLEGVVREHSPYALEVYNTYGAPLISHMDDTYVTPTVAQIPLIRAHTVEQIDNAKKHAAERLDSAKRQATEQLDNAKRQAAERLDSARQNVGKNIQYIQEQITAHADHIKRPIQSFIASSSPSSSSSSSTSTSTSDNTSNNATTSSSTSSTIIDWSSLSNQLQEGQHQLMTHLWSIYDNLYIVEALRQHQEQLKQGKTPLHTIQVQFEDFHRAVTEYAQQGRVQALELVSKMDLAARYQGAISSVEGVLTHLAAGSRGVSQALFDYIKREYSTLSTFAVNASSTVSDTVSASYASLSHSFSDLMGAASPAPDNSNTTKQKQRGEEAKTVAAPSPSPSTFSLLNPQSYTSYYTNPLSSLPSLSIDLLDQLSPRLPALPAIPASVLSHPHYQAVLGQITTLSDHARHYLPASITQYQDVIASHYAAATAGAGAGVGTGANNDDDSDDMADLSDAFGYSYYTFQHDDDEDGYEGSSCSISEVTRSFVLTQDLAPAALAPATLSPSQTNNTPLEDFSTPVAATFSTHAEQEGEQEDAQLEDHTQSIPMGDDVDDESDSSSFSDHVVSAADPGNDDVPHLKPSRNGGFRPNKKRRAR